MFLRGQKFTTEDIPHFLRSENRKSFPAKLATKKKSFQMNPTLSTTSLSGFSIFPLLRIEKGL